MHFAHHTRVPLIQRRNFYLINLMKAWRIHVSPKKKVEWHWEWEVRNGRVTKNRIRRWVDGVEEEKRELSSSSKVDTKSSEHDQKVDDEEGEIDFITMKKKVQPRDTGPMVIVDERGFEKMAPKVGSQLGDAFEMPPPQPPQSPKTGTKADDNVAFEMPPPIVQPADITTNTTIAMPPPETGPTTNPSDVEAAPVNPDVIAKAEPMPGPKRTDTSGRNDAFQVPPPPREPIQPITHRKPLNPDIGVPQPRGTKTGLSVPPTKFTSTDAAAWTWEPVNDPTGTKAVDEAWHSNESVTSSRRPTPPTPTPRLDQSTLPNEDMDLESLLPHHIRASMSRHTPSTYPPASSAAETNTWTESFGTPSEPTSYTTLTLEPLTFTASTHVPLSLLREHTSSFLSLPTPPPDEKVSSTTPDSEQEAEWLGFDPTPATTAESVFVFLLYPSSSRPSFALTTVPASIPTPTHELQPTEALDLLVHSGLFLPYLRAAREAGGLLVHASTQGATWAVTDQGMGWSVVHKLEALPRPGFRSTSVIQEEVVVKRESPEYSRSQSDNGNLAKTKGRPERSLARRMFWAGVWA
ncbi:hypothetical protein BZA05DRAFT_393253 [Tricharina praecox]|uniref:uncharacterized protein n=1 Tax=Tricharina praecox TaxID=43433 RepID=UPI002220E684|nr:uncharacterized protein BZA05DRAFT_393253 [Tricharina praecox]KAI5854111.1 hypothetical protein BZA05DRAFT_393253 [Tricharina praecox]